MSEADDGHSNQPGKGVGPAFAAAMRAELDHVLADPHFRKSPTLSRLLEYLVDQSLLGNGDNLKSYQVAVDALGRPEDFDSSTDSYPRVQIGRLRKALESFYAHHGPISELCIYLNMGSYRVRFGRLHTAYPDLYRPLSSDDDKHVATPDMAVSTAELKDPEASARAKKKPYNWVIGVISALLLLAALYYSLGPGLTPRQTARSSSPVLLLETVARARTQDLQLTADDAFATLADGLGRSWVARVRMDDGPMSWSGATEAPSYLLEMNLGGVGAQERVHLRLTDLRSSTLIWSTKLPMDRDRPMAENMGPAIAQLVGPFGVIATQEARNLPSEARTGYPCIIGYLRDMNRQIPVQNSKLNSCMHSPMADARLDAVRLALLSSTALNQGSSTAGQAEKDTARSFANRAIAAFPQEAFAHFALSRALFVTGDCPNGRLHADHAVTANPYDPILLAILGNFMANCGYKEGVPMLEKALAYRGQGESYARLSLILAAIAQKRIDWLPSLRSEADRPIGTSPAYHHLCETLHAAASDDVERARRHWRAFLRYSKSSGTSADARIRPLILSPEVRRRIIAYLARKNIL